VTADPSSPKSLSNQPQVVAQEKGDTIDHLSPVTNASTREAKDDATITIDSADPLGYGRHRRENISQKQMKADHPLAKPRAMKVWMKPILEGLDLTRCRNSIPDKML
jgi:hypothetical protein